PDIVFNIELTENSLNQASPRVIERLAALRDEKLMVAMDDFGKAYSSLRALVHYPIDVVKIDKSLADDLLVEQDRSSFIIQALVELSEALSYKITVEGVESLLQVEILKSIGVHFAQGFLFAKPMSLSELCDRIRIHGAKALIEDPIVDEDISF
ncbi:MAG: EAL domain-containing protein, partial [Microbacteriaceae bacterium]